MFDVLTSADPASLVDVGASLISAARDYCRRRPPPQSMADAKVLVELGSMVANVVAAFAQLEREYRERERA